ncbi:MAG: CopG family transcriptional regulator [Acidimicrobiia bacterium]|nr:CopG family transcriptional regulator [Acidimicrobiia bacterium]
MRTTIRIDDTLYREAKAQAARSGRSVGQVLEDALRDALRPRVGPRDVPPLVVYGGSGVMPGVDLSDSSRPRELMDDDVPFDALR